MLILQLIILVLLSIGALTDLKSRRVSNWVTHPIIIAGAAFSILENVSLTYFHLIFTVFFITAHIIKLPGFNLGSADLKAIIPLMLTLPLYPLMVFMSLITIFSGALGLKDKHSIPMFIPITLGFLITTLTA